VVPSGRLSYARQEAKGRLRVERLSIAVKAYIDSSGVGLSPDGSLNLIEVGLPQGAIGAQQKLRFHAGTVLRAV